MAEEKDTDSAPEDGVNESSAAASSPRHGIGPVSPEEPESEGYGVDDSVESEEDTDADESDPGELAVPEELADDESDDSDPDDSDEERELVGVGAASTSASGRSGGQAAKSGGRAKKDKPTPKQRSTPEKRKRMTPLEFTRGSISELKKVVWPTGSQLANYYVVVLIFVAVMIGIVMALDYGFGLLMLKVFS